jgi:aldehyde dehydrogenase (NAD+)
MVQTSKSDIASQLSKLRTSFKSGTNAAIEHRKSALQKLKSSIKKHEDAIAQALFQDLHKPAFEAFTAEIGLVNQEIDHTLKHLDAWCSKQKVPTPLTAITAHCEVVPQPKGVVLIISPWNYPYQLLMAPLVSAIAAGNVCVLKPSELAPHTAKAVTSLIQDTFSPEQCLVFEGDASVTTELLQFGFDHVFFTGSTRVGRIVAKSCAESLTPCTLELGGKSPCVVDDTANLKQAAKRIVWGKFLNAGQTCVAPDYIVVHAKVRSTLVEHFKYYIKKFYGADPATSPDFGRIINVAQFDRLSSLITGGSAIHGGRRLRDEKYIEPTIVEGVDLSHPLMKEEIFGPILPVIAWNDKTELLSILEAHPNPLAFYIFSKDDDFIANLTSKQSFGGGCINHTLQHLSSPDLPFGGIRQSGIGAYHGKTGFDLFTHYKSLLHAGPIDVSLKYPKYSHTALKLARFFQGL